MFFYVSYLGEKEGSKFSVKYLYQTIEVEEIFFTKILLAIYFVSEPGFKLTI